MSVLWTFIYWTLVTGMLSSACAALICAQKEKWFPFLCFLVMSLGFWGMEVGFTGLFP